MSVSPSRRFAYDRPVHRAHVLANVTTYCLTCGCILIPSTNRKRTGTWDPRCAMRSSRKRYIPDVPVVIAGLTVKMGLTVTNLLHGIDLVLRMNWLWTVNPIVDRCGAKSYVPNAVHTALLKGNWLEDYIKVGTVTVLLSEEELHQLKDERIKSRISVLKAPDVERLHALATCRCAQD